MKILIIGANGQVGHALQQTKHDTIALHRHELDLQSYDGNADILQNLCRGIPDIIINAAAYTAVDKCESEAKLAMQINGDSVRKLQQASEKLGCRFVHYSTDYVFSGESKTAYKETDAPSPINMYGTTKLAGEKHVNEKSLLIRTSWVYGYHGNNFIKTILRLSEERQSLDIVGDQFGVPSSAEFIAEKTYALLEKNLTGIYHVVPNGKASWYEYACYIKEIANSEVVINKIASSDYDTQAVRPHYSVLHNAKLANALGESLPDWKIDAKRTIEKILEVE